MRVGASSHASYYYGDFIKDAVYQDISNLCIQSFFGSSKKEIQQHVQSSTQKTQLYESLQPEELRRRRDDVKVASEFFVAYELREATKEDMEEFHREQGIKRQQMRQEQDRRRVDTGSSRSRGSRRDQVHYNGSNNYYQVQSPANMASGYETYSSRRKDSHDDDNPVVMGGTLGGLAGRRQQAKAKVQRPLKQYRPQDYQQPPPRRRRWKQVEANENKYQRRNHRGAVGAQQLFNTRRGYSNDAWDDNEFDGPYQDPFHNPFAMEEPVVMGGRLGSVGPAPRRQRRTQRGNVGPLFARRRYNEYQHDSDYQRQPRSAHRRTGVEQPFMVQNQSTYNEGAAPRSRSGHPNRQRHKQSTMPHEATTAHTYSSSDEMNFEYHYSPNMHQSNVKVDGLPIDDAHHEKQRPRRHRQTSQGDASFHQQQQYYQDPMGGRTEGIANQYYHTEATGDVLEKEAPMYVKGPMVGFVEIVHTPYSLGALDDPEMLTAGMKPHRSVLRNLVVAKHAQHAGIGTRLLKACEKHVQTHWQMNELVVEVDDLWNDVHETGAKVDFESKPDGCSTPSALEFYLDQGYEIALSDPESNRYDEETGELLGQIQCRRDVLRKVFEKKENGMDDSKRHSTNSHTTPSGARNNTDSTKPSLCVDATADALDVEYVASRTVSDEVNSGEERAATKEDIHDVGSPALEVELITDPSEGPRTPQANSGTTVSCDPEGPNQSIF
ncbi:MAG: hypothetical protein SGILL_005903 [Bacillariaceae sp.]